MLYRAALINEATLKEEAHAYGSTKEEALNGIDWNRPGYDAITKVVNESKTQLAGCGVHSFYVD